MTPPYAQAQVSVNGGAASSGGIDVPSAATLQFSGVSTVGWAQQQWTLYEYPEGFATPAGWTLAADGTIFSTAVLPALITLPANTVHWGPWSMRLQINEALSNNATTVPNLTDVATICHMLSPKGQRMIAALEGTQFCTSTTLQKAWVRTLQRNQIICEALLGGGGATLPVTRTIRRTAGSTSITTADDLVIVTVAGQVQTLPGTPSDGHTYSVKNKTTGNNQVYGGLNTIDASGAALMTLGPNQTVTLTWDATDTIWVAT